MVKLASSMALVALILIVPGCKDEEPNRTVEFYLENADERLSTLAKCETLDNAESEANCINALKAKEIQATEKNRENRNDAVNSLFGNGG